MKRIMLFAGLLGVAAFLSAQLPVTRAPSAPGPKDRLGSPSFDAGDYVYISAQGPRLADGTTPQISDQVRQSLDNVKRQVERAGLTLDHVVYLQVYVEDTSHYRELNTVFSAYFPQDPPARGVLGVARVPEPSYKLPRSRFATSRASGRSLYLAGPLTRLIPQACSPMTGYSCPTMAGSDPLTGAVPQTPAAQVGLALDRLTAVLEAAGLTNANMVFVNPYLTPELSTRVMNEQYARRFEFGNTPARATIEVSSLPEGTHIVFTGVAVRDLSRRKAIRPKNMPPSPTASPCVFAGDTLYCSAKSGFILDQMEASTPLRHIATSANHAKPTRQPRRSFHGFQPSRLYNCLPGQYFRHRGLQQVILNTSRRPSRRKLWCSRFAHPTARPTPKSTSLTWSRCRSSP